MALLGRAARDGSTLELLSVAPDTPLANVERILPDAFPAYLRYMPPNAVHSADEFPSNGGTTTQDRKPDTTHRPPGRVPALFRPPATPSVRPRNNRAKKYFSIVFVKFCKLKKPDILVTEIFTEQQCRNADVAKAYFRENRQRGCAHADFIMVMSRGTAPAAPLSTRGKEGPLSQ